MLKRITLFALCVLMICSASLQRLDAELVGYWNFDGSVEDLSGTDNHGKLVGAQYSDNVPSVIGSGQSLEFSGDSHVFIEAHESLDSPTFTLSMFAYERAAPGPGRIRSLVAREGARFVGSFDAAIHRFSLFNGEGQYAYRPGPGSSPIAGEWTWDDTIPTLEEWQHVAYVATEADKMKIYVDGELTLEESWNGNPSGFMHIGKSTSGIGSGNGFHGLIDNVALWNEPLDVQTIQDLAAGGNVLGDSRLTMASSVGPRGAIGSSLLTAVIANEAFSEPSQATASGLGQTWYAVAAEDKTTIDDVFRNNDPVVPYFQAESGITWWSGSDDFAGVPKYPAEVDGHISAEPYSVKLEGEILIEESGPIRFVDAVDVDDFAFLAIDLDRSGTAGDRNEEILINEGAFENSRLLNIPIMPVNFENIANGGEWLAMEANFSEGKGFIGGENGLLYWDALDEEDAFPLDQGERVGSVFDDAAELMIPNTHLRSSPEPSRLLSGDAVGTVPTRLVGWEIDVNPADGTADTFAVENPNEDIYSTIVDLDGALLSVNPLGEVTDGSSFRIVDADSVVGTPIITTEGWTFDSATGSLVFGAVIPCDPETMGDLDGNGTVEFADFLVISANFGMSASNHKAGDIDCNGTVEFADFLVISANFGQAVGAASVPEPSGLALLGFSGLFGALVCRRRLCSTRLANYGARDA